MIDDSQPHSTKRVALLVLQSAYCWSKHQDVDVYHHYDGYDNDYHQYDGYGNDKQSKIPLLTVLDLGPTRTNPTKPTD